MKHLPQHLSTLLGEEALSALHLYAELLVRQALPRGLIGFRAEAVEAEVVRSLLLLEVLPEGSDIADVGSGAGLPGIPLSLASRKMTLIEPSRRALGFLEGARRLLRADFEILPIRAEDAASSHPERFDRVVARALAPPERALELCAPLCSAGGSVVLTASPATQQQFSEELLESLRMEAPERREIPGVDISLNVLMMLKSDSTSPRDS